MTTFINWLIENYDIVTIVILLAIALIATIAFKFLAPKGILWMLFPPKDTVSFHGTKQSNEKVIRGNKGPKGIFQKLWRKLGIYWIGPFRQQLEFPQELRSIKLENAQMVGVDAPVPNKHATIMPVTFPVAGVSRFVVKNGTVQFIYNLYCKIDDNAEVEHLGIVRSVPQWQELLLTTVYAVIENLLKDDDAQKIATMDIMDENKPFQTELKKVNPGLSERFHVTITHADVKFDEEANVLQAESLNQVGVNKNLVAAKIVLAEGDKTLAQIASDTAIIKLEQTKTENKGIIDLEKQLKSELKDSYGTYKMAKAIENTNAHTVALQNEHIIPIPTS